MNTHTLDSITHSHTHTVCVSVNCCAVCVRKPARATAVSASNRSIGQLSAGTMSAPELVGGIATLLQQLVPQLGTPEQDVRAERLLQLCLRIVSSRMAGGAAPSEAAAAEATRRRLVQSGRAADGLKYTELLQLLSNSDHGLQRLPAALQLLTSLVHTSTTPLHTAAGASAALQARTAANATVPTVMRKPVLPEPVQSAHTSARAPPVSSSAQGKRLPRGENSSGAEGALGERTLVRELLFVLQNIDGAHLKWDAALDSFALPRCIAHTMTLI